MDWIRRTHEPFIYGALLVALTAGFGYGALMVSSLAAGILPGPWWAPVVQAHGHGQLYGWVGLFVLGMGLYFLPRLYGVKLQRVARIPYAFGLILGGIILRVIVQPMLGFNFLSGATAQVLEAAWALSAALELAGILVLGSILVATRRAAKPLTTESPAYATEPYLRIAFLSLLIAFFVNTLGVWIAAMNGLTSQGKPVVAPALENIVTTLMLYGLAVPMAIVFSTRTLPLFMRLAPPPRNSLRVLAVVYGIGLVLVLLPSAVAAVETLPPGLNLEWLKEDLRALFLDGLVTIGWLALNLCILVFLWRLDLVHSRQPWIVNRAPNTRPDLDYLRKPTRENYPDAGEYGRFELLIYSAYAWLAFAVLLNLARLLGEFTGWVSIPADTTRHALAVGFISLLIFGMAARMVPGFSQKKRLAYPSLVMVTFLLGNLAAFLRVVPTLFPEYTPALQLWGLSGIIAWAAIAVLAVNLVCTFNQTFIDRA